MEKDTSNGLLTNEQLCTSQTITGPVSGQSAKRAKCHTLANLDQAISKQPKADCEPSHE